MEGLAGRGQAVISVCPGSQFEQTGPDSFTIDPNRPEDYMRLFHAISAGGRQPGDLIHTWSATSVANAAGSRFEECQRVGMYSLLHTLQALGPQENDFPRRILLVDSRSAHVESGDEILPEKAGAAILCKIAAQEYVGLHPSVVDIVPPSTNAGARQVARQILSEFFRRITDAEIAYRGTKRWVRCYEPAPLAASHPPARNLRVQGTYLITGGLGAVGLLIAHHLGTALGARVVLLAHSPLPARSEWPAILSSGGESHLTTRIRTILSLEQAGIEYETFQADVCDRAAMQAAVRFCRERFGRLDGVIHAAGVTGGPSVFCPIQELTEDLIRTQARPKLEGLYVLQEVLQGSDVPFVLTLSSNAAVIGGLGFCAYAAANSFMDAFASKAAAAEETTCWISASWDHWPKETMRVTHIRTALDDYAMTREEALDATSRVLSGIGAGHVIIATGNLRQRIEQWASSPSGAPQRETRELVRSHRPRLRTPYVEPRTAQERALVEIWRDLLGIEQVGIQDDFFELGGHSLLATRIVARIRSSLGMQFPLAAFFEGPTVLQLAQVLQRLDASPGLERDAAPAPEAAAMTTPGSRL
jgi:NAD(P)-dependent dehydrogenase (short-subunit alcohol dehydrogenase family)